MDTAWLMEAQSPARVRMPRTKAFSLAERTGRTLNLPRIHTFRHMDHTFIEEHNIAYLYLLGKLPAEEQQNFEEHFIVCPECLDCLETTESFIDSLKTVAIEDIPRPHAYVQAGILVWLVRLSRKRQAMLLSITILLLVALPAAIFVVEMRRARGELDQAKLAYMDRQRQFEEKQQTVQKLEKELQESRQKSAEQRQHLETELGLERQEKARLTDGANRAGRSHSIATVFSLINTRSADPTQPSPKNEIVISRSSQLIILSPEFYPDPNIQTYRGAITTVDNRPIWRGDKLQLNLKGTIELGFSARLFSPSDYLFTLEGLTKRGKYVQISTYPFTVMIK
jgi:putative zinc finger protein